jgi:hypothetical protein
MTRLASISCVLGLLVIAGCDAPDLPPVVASSTPAPAPAPVQEDVAGLPGPPLPDDEIPVTDVPRKFDAKDPIKGRRTRAEGGVAGNFGAALWAKHQGMIQAIDHANQLYWPQNNFSYPKTHESFMKDVVALALNGEPLPEIPEDEEYIYVPEQGEVGLQIRLIPGSPRSKIPAAEPGKEHIFDPQILAAAGVPIPPPQDANTAPNGEELSPDPRVRAQQLGERGNERAVAPGGLAPAGGL